MQLRIFLACQFTLAPNDTSLFGRNGSIDLRRKRSLLLNFKITYHVSK